MALKKELLLVFLMSCFFSAYSEDFDYFWHVQQWPPSLCSEQVQSPRCFQHVSAFVIYGFWPEYKDGKYPIDCNGPAYNSTAIQSIRPQLYKYWPNLKGPVDELAWALAWTRNGVCSSSKFNQEEYFKRAVEIRVQYDIAAILKEAGVSPSWRFLPDSIVRSVIENKVGKKPGLRCRNVSGMYLLDRVVLCYEKDGVTLMDCPSAVNKCPRMFIWPVNRVPYNNLALVTEN